MGITLGGGFTPKPPTLVSNRVKMQKLFGPFNYWKNYGSPLIIPLFNVVTFVYIGTNFEKQFLMLILQTMGNCKFGFKKILLYNFHLICP